MRRSIVWTNQFKKDYRLSIKRGLDIELPDNAIRTLADGNPLPVEYKDHQLSNCPPPPPSPPPLFPLVIDNKTIDNPL